MDTNRPIKKKLTLAEIQELTGYSTTITTYQTLRKKGVHPVSFRKNPIQGGDLGEYDTAQVLACFRHRIQMHQLKSKAEK